MPQLRRLLGWDPVKWQLQCYATLTPVVDPARVVRAIVVARRIEVHKLRRTLHWLVDVVEREEHHQRGGQVGFLQTILLPDETRRFPCVQVRVCSSILPETRLVGAVKIDSALCRTHLTALQQNTAETELRRGRSTIQLRPLATARSYRCVVRRAVELLGCPAVAVLAPAVDPVLITWNCILAAVTLGKVIFATAKKAKRRVEAATVWSKLVRVEALVPLEAAQGTGTHSCGQHQALWMYRLRAAGSANLSYLCCEVSSPVQLFPNHREVCVALRLRRHAEVALLDSVSGNSTCLHAHGFQR